MAVNGESRNLQAEAKAFIGNLTPIISALSAHYPLDTPQKLEDAEPLWWKLYGAIVFTTVDDELEKAILTHPSMDTIVPQVREATNRCEAAFEISTAEKIISAGSTSQANETLLKGEMHNFYDLFFPVEWSALLTSLGGVPKHVTILGSGALPETGLCIRQWAKDHGHRIKIHHVELLPERIELSKKVHKALGALDDDATFEFGDARTCPADMSMSDAVWFNATIGATSAEKEAVLLSVVQRMKKGAFMVTRSTYSLKTMVYPAVEIRSPNVLRVMQPVLTCHSSGAEGRSVNSSIIVSRVL